MRPIVEPLLVTAIVCILAWLVVAATMHTACGGSSTGTTYGDALGATGWASAPALVTTPAVLGFAWYRLTQLRLEGSDPAQIVAELEVLESATAHPVTFALFSLVIGWSVYVLANGIAATHEVATTRTIVPALLIGAGSLLLAFV